VILLLAARQRLLATQIRRHERILRKRKGRSALLNNSIVWIGIAVEASDQGARPDHPLDVFAEILLHEWVAESFGVEKWWYEVRRRRVPRWSFIWEFRNGREVFRVIVTLATAEDENRAEYGSKHTSGDNEDREKGLRRTVRHRNRPFNISRIL
jgi:hypothetical protein